MHDAPRRPGSQRQRLQRPRPRRAAAAGRLQGCPKLGQAVHLAADIPVPAECPRQSHGDVRIVYTLACPIQGHAEVGVIVPKAGQPGTLLTAAELRLCALCESGVVARVPAACLRILARVHQPGLRVGADGLEHAETPALCDHERAIDQGRQRIQNIGCVAVHARCRRLERPPAENGQVPQQRSLGIAKQLVAPSTTARSVRCRSSAVRGPLVNNAKRSSSRAAISAAVIVLTRAAASSIASGMPSSRSAMLRTSSSAPSSVNSGWMARARSTKRRTASSVARGGTRI